MTFSLSVAHCKKKKSPFDTSSIHTLDALWLRSANLRVVLSEQLAISGTTWAIAGGMTAQSTYSI
jgi:hypothetical protein